MSKIKDIRIMPNKLRGSIPSFDPNYIDTSSFGMPPTKHYLMEVSRSLRILRLLEKKEINFDVFNHNLTEVYKAKSKYFKVYREQFYKTLLG